MDQTYSIVAYMSQEGYQHLLLKHLQAVAVSLASPPIDGLSLGYYEILRTGPTKM